MTRLAALLLLLQAGGVRLKYGAEPGPGQRVFTEQRISIKIEGTEAMVGLVRSLHPLLGMEKLLIRAEGTRLVTPEGKHKFDYDEARVEMRLDGKDHEYEYARGMPPEGDQDKTRQMMWYLAAAGRTFSLSPEGEYRSEDASQDHHGEAMDLIALGITRMPSGAVREGDSYEEEWKGSRADKEKKGVFAFRQKARVEKIEDREGRKTATLVSTLSGTLEAPAGVGEKPREDSRTTCEGKTKVVLEVDSGRVVSSEGSGRVVGRFRGTGEGGAPAEVTLTFECEGKTRIR